jgi:hypothetical protein
MRNVASILSSLRLASGGNQDRGTWAGRLETTIVGAIWRAGGPSQPLPAVDDTISRRRGSGRPPGDRPAMAWVGDQR